jgi:iron complex transport system permease protein
MYKRIWLAMVIVLLLAVLLPFFGSKTLNPLNWSSLPIERFLFWQLRLPRTLLALLSGAMLGLTGLLCQRLFRNHLASPDILGVFSGAAAGAVVAIKWHVAHSFLGVGAVCFFGFAGALLSALLLLSLVRLMRAFTLYGLLMAGLTINVFFSSFIVFLQYLLDYANTVTIFRWLLGGIAVTGYREIIVLLPFFVLLLFMTFAFVREWVLVSVGEDFAQSKGLDLLRFRMAMFGGVALVSGAVVAVVGPIGFIALLVPHIARLLGKNRFPLTAILCLFFGASLLALADFFSRILIPPVEIPVGIITSFLGAPFFLVLLVTALRRGRGGIH